MSVRSNIQPTQVCHQGLLHKRCERGNERQSEESGFRFLVFCAWCESESEREVLDRISNQHRCDSKAPDKGCVKKTNDSLGV